MSITLTGQSGTSYTFEGPKELYELQDSSGVYFIGNLDTASTQKIDVGESATVKSRISNHDRKDCWELNRGDYSIKYFVLYTSNKQQPGRREIEQDLRDNTRYDWKCGDR